MDAVQRKRAVSAVRLAVKKAKTQTELAGLVRVKQPTVSEWATGDRPVPVRRCLLIEWHLKVPVEELRPDVKWVRVADRDWPNPKGRPLEDAGAAAFQSAA